MPHILHRLAAFGTFAVFGSIASAVNAQNVYFPKNAMIDYHLPFPDFAIVGYANDTDYNNKIHGVSPTVSLVDGGSLDYLSAYNSSAVNVRNGSIRSGLSSFNNSSINISGGSGNDLSASDSSSAVVTGGLLFGSAYARDSSKITINGGRVYNDLYAYNSSTVNLNGGSVGPLDTENSSTVNIRGGSIVGPLITAGNSVVNLSGGNIKNNLSVSDTSSLNLFGTGLGDTLTGYFYNGHNYAVYALLGKLSDGTSITGKSLYVQTDSNANVIFHNAVPEPGSIALLAGMAGAGAALLRRRRR